MTIEAPLTTGDDRTSIISCVAGLAVVSVLSITFALALAAIVYVGPLAPHVGRGIGLMLLGGAVMPIVAAMLSSYRGLVFHIQDIPALLISLAAASIAVSLPAEIAFATVATLVALTCFLTGVTLVAGSVLKLGFLARYIPYSVIGGFLAATGLLLTTGALGMMVGEQVTVLSPGILVETGMPALWVPWFIYGVLLAWATRRVESPLVLPGAIFAAVVTFYLTLEVFGIDQQTAGDMGLLVGPFEDEGFYDGLSYSIAASADWQTILAQSPTIIAVIAMTFIGLLLNASGLEVATGHDFDMERELRSAGLANMAGGAFGGQTGFHLIGETLLVHKMGVRGLSAAISVSVTSGIVLLFGAGLIGNLPIGLLAGLIIMLGVDFLYEWFWVKRKQLPWTDRALVFGIMAVAATVGFLEAFFIGLLAASIMFITSYSRIEVVRMTTTAATRRSSVERPAKDTARIEAEGGNYSIYALSGYLFFGTAHRLLDRIRNDLAEHEDGSGLIVDFSRVTGLDSSAGFILERIAGVADQRNHSVFLAGLPPNLGQRVLTEALSHPNFHVHETLDAALIDVENRILRGAEDVDVDLDALLKNLQARNPDVDLSGIAVPVTLSADEVLFRAGETSNTVYRLISGALRAEVDDPNANKFIVARFRPGALIGEIAYYSDMPRSADVVAETESVVLRYDLAALDDTPEAAEFARDFHREAAKLLSQRLFRMTRLVRDANL